METKKFKTNIMCGSCIAKVTPVLNEELGTGNWQVDISSPSKILTASFNKANEEEMVNALKKIGYKAEEMK